MKKRMAKIVQVCLLIAALVIPAHMVYAYFTDYDTAKGSATVGLKPETHTDETVDKDGNKTIKITNTGNAGAVVRVAVFGSNMTVAPSSDWTDGGDGFYYYGKVLGAGEETSAIEVTVKNVTENGFDIVVVHESALAQWIFLEGQNKVVVPEGWADPNIWEPIE